MSNGVQKIKDLDNTQLGNLRRVRSMGVWVGNAMRHVDRTRPGVCRRSQKEEETWDHLWWRCEACQELRRRRLPEFAEGDEAAMPPILRHAGVLSEAVVGHSRSFWGGSMDGGPA